MTASRVLVIDGLRDPEGDVAGFIADMVAFTNGTWARHGVAGCNIVTAEWNGLSRVISIETIPGAEALTVARLSAFLKGERARVARRMAEGMARLL